MLIHADARMSTENTIILDTRNYYETAIGSFDGAADPKLRCFAQFPAYVQQVGCDHAVA